MMDNLMARRFELRAKHTDQAQKWNITSELDSNNNRRSRFNSAEWKEGKGGKPSKRQAWFD